MDLFLAQNTTIQNQYRIIEKMGEGGMGIVYRAQDLKSEREVALKFLNPKYTSGYVEDIIRFRREVESVSKLDHPNIVRMFGSGDFNNTPYFVTELMEGVSLSMWMEHKEKMSIENCVNIIKAVAQALDYVHNKGIIHRDVTRKLVALGYLDDHNLSPAPR